MRISDIKRILILLVWVLLLGVPQTTWAGLLEGSSSNSEMTAKSQADTSRWSQFTSQVKEKVSGWLNRWTSPKEAANTETQEQSQTADSRAPASEGSQTQQNAVAPVAVAPSAVPGTQSQALKEIATSIQSKPVVTQVKEARKPTTSLPLTKSGVPTFSLVQTKTEKTKQGTREVKIPVKDIPLLDIGDEAVVKAEDFKIGLIEIPRISPEKVKKREAPALWTQKELQKALGAPIAKVKPPEKINLATLKEDQMITLSKVEKVTYQIGSEIPVKEVPFTMLSEDELKYLRALILYEQKDKCHIAAGLLYDLSENKDYKSSASFYLGICLHKMGLFSESIDRLIRSIEGGDPEYVARSIESLSQDLPDEFEVKVGKVLETVIEGAQVKPEVKINAYYVISKGALKRDAYLVAHKYADRIPLENKRYREAQFIMAVCEYATGQGSTSISRLEKLKTLLDKVGDNDLKPLVALNLARVSFQEKKYKQAATHFMDISKGHPLWIQALTEQAWAQLMSNDNEGAIGNMHSIQSPYFNTVYKPESYVVRTIGYLNLCQYPDAYRTLSRLEAEYKPWLEKMRAFLKKTNGAKEYYATLVKYLSSPSQTEVGGLPFQVLREMGRHRDYLNVQEAINHRIDEKDQYGFLHTLIRKDMEKVKWLKAQSKARLKAAGNKIKASAKDAKLAANLNQFRQDKINEENLIDYYDFQLAVFDEGKASMRKLEDRAKAKLELLKTELIVRAGEILKKRLSTMVKDLDALFENNEFLRYEVFAGSGENIRFEMAGGEKRIPSTVKPSSKALNWNFDGEFWEDEIGHYKSSLKNNCPKDRQAASNK